MEYAGIAIIPLIIGLLEIVKKAGLKEKYVPLISLIFGLIAGLTLFADGDAKTGVIQGVFIGLSAVGLYSGTKNTVEEFNIK